jgi:hypothetical protein
MTEEERKKAGGRPATGHQYPHKVFGYFDQAGVILLDRLAQRTKQSRAAVLRQAVEEMAKREGVG